MPLNIQFQRTSEERTGDSQRPFQFNHSLEHMGRVEAHRLRVQRDYFDSGVYKLECSKDYGKIPLRRDGRSRDD